MAKKSIVIGAYGQIILKEELLRHLKVKPGQKLSYKLLPGNKLLLENIVAEQEWGQNDPTQASSYYQLMVLTDGELLFHPDIYQTMDKRLLH